MICLEGAVASATVAPSKSLRGWQVGREAAVYRNTLGLHLTFVCRWVSEGYRLTAGVCLVAHTLSFHPNRNARIELSLSPSEAFYASQGVACVVRKEG